MGSAVPIPSASIFARVLGVEPEELGRAQRADFSSHAKRRRIDVEAAAPPAAPPPGGAPPGRVPGPDDSDVSMESSEPDWARGSSLD